MMLSNFMLCYYTVLSFKHRRNSNRLTGFIYTAFLVIISCVSTTVQAQSNYRNPWTPANLGPFAPIASLTNGVWLKGDLHVHSRHSTESSNNPVAKIIDFCDSVGMDYVCITDHDNHVNGDVEHHTWADPEFKSDSVLLLYGAEWTTTRGHGNTFSAKPYDHRQLYDARDQRDLVVQAIKKELGVHLSANHPSGKDHFGYSYDMLESIEVWNSVLWSNNANAIMIWDDMLSSGRKLTGRGGSDAHHGVPETPDKATKNSNQAKANYVGTPTTWVYATERSSKAVVDALTNGRVSVSANPYAPRVEFYADQNQDGRMDMMMGDNAKSTGKPVTFRIQLTNMLPNESYTITIIKNGSRFDSLTATGEKPVVEFSDTPVPLTRSYYRVIVEGRPTPYPQVPQAISVGGKMIALSNPICFNFDPNF